MAIPPWGAKPGTSGGGGTVSSVSNVDGTLTISPTTGSVVASIATSAALPGSPTTTTQSAGDNSTKIATDAFVTTAVANAISGVNPAVAVVVATTSAANTSGLTYNNGASGIGATFTGSVNTALTIDGVTLTSLTQRVLVKDDTQSPSGAFNGVYTLTQLQTAILPPILTRALDYDQPSDINSTGAIPVTSGTVNASTSWLLTSSVATIGTDPLTYTQFTLNPTTIATSANNLSFFATTTSSQLAGVISDETGSGALVFGTSPTLVTPALGTPASGVATNLTGTASGLTSGITNALASATTTVNVSSATAPSSGQVLTATSSTAATWQSNMPGITWSAITTSGTASINTGSITNSGSLITVTLPSTAAVGSVVEVAGLGTGGWKVAQAVSVQINFGSTVTTVGTGGSLASTNQWDAVRLLCVTANTGWSVLSSTGNLTVT